MKRKCTMTRTDGETLKKEPLSEYVKMALVALAAQKAVEVCGFVRLKEDAAGLHMIVHPMENVSNNPVRFFEMDDEEMVEYYRNHMPRHVGMYHSHPNGILKPSPADIENAPLFGRYFVIARGMVIEWDLTNRQKPVRVP